MIDPKLLKLNFTPQNLTTEQKFKLDNLGFIILPNIINSAWRQELRQAFENIMSSEGEHAGQETGQMAGVRRLSDLVNKGAVFDPIYIHPLLLACVAHVLKQPFKLYSLNGHDPLPGQGQQILHSDGGKFVGPPMQHQMVNSMWMLDDFTPNNGATRVVPGSHLEFRDVGEKVEDPLASHPEQVLLCAPAGSVGIFNGSVWHSCTQNSSSKKRRAVHCAFVLRQLEQQTDQSAHLKPETEKRLSPLSRHILDV